MGDLLLGIWIGFVLVFMAVFCLNLYRGTSQRQAERIRRMAARHQKHDSEGGYFGR